LFRSYPTAQETVVIYRFADFELDTECYELRRRGVVLSLARRPFDLLLCLIERRQRVVLKHELIDVVWGGSCVSGATLSHCVMELRRALSDAAGEPRFLRTVRGRGYRFIATLTAPLPAESGQPPRKFDAARVTTGSA
jgi:DNA-binding winged helix-turn-helix (wHTH) protein